MFKAPQISESQNPPLIPDVPIEEKEDKQFEIGQEIAFIYNRTDVVSGVIRDINPDDTFDLICKIPSPVTSVDFNPKKDFSRTTKTSLVEREFLKARLCDPRMQFRKQTLPLAQPIQVNNGEHGNSTQTHFDVYVPILDRNGEPRLLRTPKLTGFHTNIVGCFFDPSIYFFTVEVWKAQYEDKAHKIFEPEIRKSFPSEKKGGIYREFSKAFNKYFKEYHGRLGYWNTVEIKAILKEDFKG